MLGTGARHQLAIPRDPSERAFTLAHRMRDLISRLDLGERDLGGGA